MSHVYLVQYGRSAFVGRYSSSSSLTRGESVILRTPRGVELGSVLARVEATEAVEGELLRVISPEDQVRHLQLASLAQAILELAESCAAPVTFLDAEPLLNDVPTIILQVLPWGECQLDTQLQQWELDFGVKLQVQDASGKTAAKDEAGCGKPGCGSEGGGCSTGSCGTSGGGCSTGGCSRGAAKTADELTAYFAGLREQMQAASARTPLN